MKLIFKSNVIFVLIFSSFISNKIVLFQNKAYENIYTEGEEIQGIAVVIGKKEEKTYSTYYKIKLGNYYLYLSVSKKQNNPLNYGDEIQVKGIYQKPNHQRNQGGFNQQLSWKSKKIVGILQANEVQLIGTEKGNLIIYFANVIFEKLEEKMNRFLEKEEAALLKGILLGDSSQMEEGVQNCFRISGIAHVLAVSGMHVSYIMLGFTMIFEKILGKKKTRIIFLFFLIFYMILTDFTPSVVRAGIMTILMCGSKLLYRKNNVINSMAFSLLVILIDNPYAITNVGLQFSYVGTIGILLFYPIILNLLQRKKNKKKFHFAKMLSRLQGMLAVILSAQITILPLSLFHFNQLGIYFIITNILISLIIGIVVILGFMTLLISFLFFPIVIVLSLPLKIGLHAILAVSQVSQLPFSSIYFPTPTVWQILVYYFVIICIRFFYLLYQEKEPSMTQIRVKNIVAFIRFQLRQNHQKCKVVFVLIPILVLIILFIPQKLKIHFVDVGQGDCTLIETPLHHTILIDGGGSESKEFDVGKSILLPYLLDKGYTKVDYIFISHFDQDHVGGIFTIMEECQVGEVIFPEQIQDSDNYREFIGIVREKKIKIRKVKKGSVVSIEKNLYFQILWPQEEQIKKNILNNNSMVAKLYYHDFTMLFTGDIEEIAEEEILKQNKGVLQSGILKVAHHGSKTSSTQVFLEAVNPKIAIIGVGKNNIFGHPNLEVLARLTNLRCENY